jgi:hypothetical protein
LYSPALPGEVLDASNPLPDKRFRRTGVTFTPIAGRKLLLRGPATGEVFLPFTMH